MTHIKLCGFQTAEPVMAVIEAGADAVGLVFVPSARRCLALDDARRLVSEVRAQAGDRMPELVGLFADQPVEDVRRHIEELKLDAVQLCGAEDVAYASKLGVPVVYKVIGIDPEVPIGAQMPRVMVLQHRHQLAGHRIVIDTKVVGEYGGTGRTFDWEIAAELARGLQLSLAGGLNPDNVGGAVRAVKPWGVDASSGVETDGVKDIEKVRVFVEAVRGADRGEGNGGLMAGVARLFGRKAKA